MRSGLAKTSEFNIKLSEDTFKVVVVRKNIKRIYLRTKKDLCLHISCNFIVSDSYIKRFILDNEKAVFEMINKEKKILDKENYFILLGNKYQIIECNTFDKIYYDEDKVYIRNIKMLEKEKIKCANEIFNERLIKNYNKMQTDINCPSLIIKKMKAKWGYYNKNKHLICLNLNLISYDINDIDYVIVHELSHMIHFNHSKEFWNLVGNLKPDYKKNKINLKE